jgi:hypothetical protein
MSRLLALELAEPDAIGVRWATARADDRTYLACRWPDDTELVEVHHVTNGIHYVRRLAKGPRWLTWKPLEVGSEPQLANVSG